MSDANQEHLEQLRKGATHFNLWRRNNLTGQYSVPYLVGADLSGLDLSGSDLNRAHMGQVNLTNANLTGANLEEAKLGAAKLNNAIMKRANLVKTYFGDQAVLDGVDLTGAVYDSTTRWPQGFDPRKHAATAPPVASLQADHYIIRLLPPDTANRDALIGQILSANGYVRGAATIDFRADSEAGSQAYMMGLLLTYEKTTAVPLDSARSKMHKLSGGANGHMVAVFHKRS
jgi:uncharacterized protein YjbI with pentapeptide repeats